jgi:hypothetical protein
MSLVIKGVYSYKEFVYKLVHEVSEGHGIIQDWESDAGARIWYKDTRDDKVKYIRTWSYDICGEDITVHEYTIYDD